MATKTWNGTTGTFDTGADWMGMGVPQPGDTADITAGTVLAAGLTLDQLFIAVTATSAGSPVLTLSNSTLTSGTTVELDASGSTPTVQVLGTTTNAGTITLAQASGSSQPVLELADGGGTPSVLENTGTIDAVGYARLASSGAGNALANDGSIAISGTAPGQYVAVSAPISGIGTITLADNGGAEFSGAVGAGQTLVFAPTGATTAAAYVDNFTTFQAATAGWSSKAQLFLPGATETGFTYTSTSATSGTLALQNGTATTTSLAVSGDYAANSFAVSSSNGITEVTGTDAAPIRLYGTDVVTNTNFTGPLSYYTDPNVPYLQWDYLWNSPDAVALSAQVDNVFLHGGAAGDALQAYGGSNVLDGGGGSNYLVGATGADGGKDTFFVDGRGGVETWSSIVNFHPGDLAVIFGFNQGVSTVDWENNQGASGATGLTLHSALAGAGTPVNASFTLAGLSTSDLASHLDIAYGHQATEGNDYILIAYDR